MQFPIYLFGGNQRYYTPLPFVKNIFYHDLDLYHYFIGREDQSVNYKTMCKRYEQQMRVYKEMFTAYRYEEIVSQTKRLKKYMFKWLMTVCAITLMTIVGVKDDKKVRKESYKKYFSELKKIDKKLYNKIRYRTLCSIAFAFPGFNAKHVLARIVYRSLQKRLKLG